MNRILWISVVVLLFMAARTGITGEYYQYTDKDGNPVFTDDITKVPEKDRPQVKTFQSAVSKPQPSTEDQVNSSPASQESEEASPSAEKTEEAAPDEQNNTSPASQGSDVASSPKEPEAPANETTEGAAPDGQTDQSPAPAQSDGYSTPPEEPQIPAPQATENTVKTVPDQPAGRSAQAQSNGYSTSPGVQQMPVPQAADKTASDPSVNPSSAQTESNSSLKPQETSNKSESDYQVMAGQFEREKKQMDQQLGELQAEREKIGNTKFKDMTKEQLNANEEKVKDLNDRISRLQRDQAEFQERVRQFNERMKNKPLKQPAEVKNPEGNT